MPYHKLVSPVISAKACLMFDKQNRTKNKQSMLVVTNGNYITTSPTSSSSLQFTATAILGRKTSPYVGWFRHAPPVHHYNFSPSLSSRNSGKKNKTRESSSKTSTTLKTQNKGRKNRSKLTNTKKSHIDYTTTSILQGRFTETKRI